MNIFEHRFEADRLMVVIPGRISDLIAKGETTERYYNPGELFSEVHLVLTNDDQPDPAQVQKMVGEARLFIHCIPAGKRLFIRSAGWRPRLLGGWAEACVGLAERIRPSLIRCHGAHLNAFAAHRIRRKLGIPYVVSLHINPDEDIRGRARTLQEHIVGNAIRAVEKVALRNADLVLPVYRPIVPYLKRLGVERFEVAYNVLNPSRLLKKEDYRIHAPVRVVSVGRQIKEKNPENLIKAVGGSRNVHLTLIGDGPYHDHLKRVASACGRDGCVTFHRAIANDELCVTLRDYDIFAIHSEYWEISKCLLEAFLVGLHVIINRRCGEPVPELSPGICMLVENSVDGYAKALGKLISDDPFREGLGRGAWNYAQEHWSPEKTEMKYVDIYRRILSEGRNEPR